MTALSSLRIFLAKAWPRIAFGGPPAKSEKAVLPMPEPKLNRLSACNAQAGAREQRIEQEIVVDAYTSEERAMGYAF